MLSPSFFFTHTHTPSLIHTHTHTQTHKTPTRLHQVLSVCSVQYKCVTDSQKRKTMMPGRGLEYIDDKGVSHKAIEKWTFVAADGIEMPLEEGCSGFITMNPGYIGRAELPESLKVSGRPAD